MCRFCLLCYFFKQKTAYEMRISDWSSDVCSSVLLGEALLQLFLVVVAGRGFNLRLDFLDARGDAFLLAGAVDDGGVFLLDLDLLGGAEIGQRGLLDRQAELFGDHRAAGEDGDVLEHFLADRKSTRLNSSH